MRKSHENLEFPEMEALTDALNTVIRICSKGRVKKEIATALENAHFTPKQQQELQERFTPSLATLFNIEKDSNPNRDSCNRACIRAIANAFDDVPRKKAQILCEPEFRSDDDDVLKRNIAILRQYAKEATYNYKKILGPRTPVSVKEIMNIYETKIIPLCDTVLQGVEIQPDMKTGFEHIAPLPEEWTGPYM